MRSALVAGHVCVDLVPVLREVPDAAPGQLVEVGLLRMSAGGCVANTGAGLAALGTPVAVAGEAGDDELGAALLRLLSARGVDAGQLRRRPGASTSYSLVLEPSGVDRSFWHHVGANAGFDGADLDLSGVDLLHVGYPSLLPALIVDDGAPLEALLLRARAAGVTTSLDLAVVDPGSPAAAVDWPGLLARVLPLVDVLSPSLDDVRTSLDPGVGHDPGDGSVLLPTADRLADMGAGVVLLTGGPAGLALSAAAASRLRAGGAAFADGGLAARWAGARRFERPPPSTVRSTLAAGDAASAGLLAGILAGLGPDQSLSAAARTAARLVSGQPLVPLV